LRGLSGSIVVSALTRVPALLPPHPTHPPVARRAGRAPGRWWRLRGPGATAVSHDRRIPPGKGVVR
jgi:hypothetical protein